jgi:hypothetical protein
VVASTKAISRTARSVALTSAHEVPPSVVRCRRPSEVAAIPVSGVRKTMSAGPRLPALGAGARQRGALGEGLAVVVRAQDVPSVRTR